MNKLLSLLLFCCITNPCLSQVETGQVYYINKNAISFYEEPTSDSNIISTLDMNIGVLVKESNPKWSLVSFDGKDGYVKTELLSSSLYEIRETQRVKQIVDGLSISDSKKEKILNSIVWIGMSDKLAELSWGEPTDINRTITANMVREQWVYNSYIDKTKYLYFENGTLVTIQE